MTPQEEKSLQRAVEALEGNSLIARLTSLTGEPISQLMGKLPGGVNARINEAVRRAMAKALDAALYRMDARGRLEPVAEVFQVACGVAGGLSGFFGVGALAVELPLTTTLMLRSIAGIAARHGERLDEPAGRLACLEVFAVGPQGKGALTAETSYYAARTFLARTVREATQAFLERGATGASAPAIVDFIGAVGSRFGVVVSEKTAAGAIPVVGALGGAAVNVAFMRHFQNIARAHFTVRALERRYGPESVRQSYQRHDKIRKARPANIL